MVTIARMSSVADAPVCFLLKRCPVCTNACTKSIEIEPMAAISFKSKKELKIL